MSRKTLVILLFVSLAVNLFVMGAFAGVALTRFRPPPPQHFGQGRPGLAAAAAALTPEQREAWRQALRDQAQESAPKLRESRMVRRQAWDGLGAEPLDAAAIRADLARSRQLEQDARAAMDERMVAFAATLSPQERAAFGKAVAQRPGMGGPGMGGGGRGREGMRGGGMRGDRVTTGGPPDGGQNGGPNGDMGR
jgi:uncharacterized membrane protein